LSRRRYELVDPANRLVADTLETDWNNKLQALETARQEYQERKPTESQLRSTKEQMEHVVTHLKDYWYTESFSFQDKKELLRCLIEHVFLENCGKIIHTQLNWYGGAVSTLSVPKYLFSSPHLYHRIGELAKTHTDREIASVLNQEGLLTFKGKAWTHRRVMDFRLSNRIPSGFTTKAALRLQDSEYITSIEAAEQLGVNQTTIQKWYRAGILTGKKDGRQSHLWIRWSEEVAYRLNGSAIPDPQMVSVRTLCRTKEKRPAEIFAWARANGHAIYRLRRGKAMIFFILPKEG
jgi:hypothetical protein